DESAFNTFTGYAGNVINDTLVPYGDFDTNVIQYYFDAGNGFSAVLSLEEGSGVKGTIDSYVPHVVGGLKWTQGWGGISGVVAYDSNYEEVAGKVRLDVNVSDAIQLWVMGGYGTDDNLSDPTWHVPAGGRGFYKQWGGNWAIWGGGTYKFNEKTSFNTQISYDEDENLGIAANIAYDVVPGFTVTAEVDYVNAGSFPASNWTGADDDSSIGGLLRFQRSF
ncbi:porin, partial [Mesorhizobium sp. M7A.F.Ca.MR.148.00.0.0]